MSRSIALVSTLVLAVLLAAVPAAASAKELRFPSPLIEIEFDLPANHGLRAKVTNSEKVELVVQSKREAVSYEVPGEVTENGLKAKFGGLGEIDVSFEPTKTLKMRPPKRCEGTPSTLSEGFFVGTIEFTGEREYVHIETGRAKGSLDVWREAEWRCHRHRAVPSHRRATAPEALRSLPRDSAPAALGSLAKPSPKSGPASLVVANRHCRCFLAAFTERDHTGRGASEFLGVKLESREKMEIVRAAEATAGASAFAFDHAAGTASVRPPAPFTGHGAFKRRPHARDLWRSTIEVPLLGADPLGVSGRSYRATLVRDLPGD